MSIDEIAQRRRNVEALELLEQSHAAHARGDRPRSRELIRQAREIAPDTVLVVGGAMRIGEVPQPGTPGWSDYLADHRDALTRLEDEEAAG